VIVMDRSTGEQYRFGMPGPRLSDAERLRWIEAARGLPVSTEYVVVSGGLTAAAPGEWYGDLLRSFPRGARIIVDSKQDALRRALDVGVYLIKPNLGELEEVVGRQLSRDEEIERAAREIIERRDAEVVLVSLGRGGAILVTDRGMSISPLPRSRSAARSAPATAWSEG
jgi:6-phosphofructokinase 2